MLEDAAALCAKSFVKFFMVDDWSDRGWRLFLRMFLSHLPGIRIQRLLTVDSRDEVPDRTRAGFVMRASTDALEQEIIKVGSTVYPSTLHKRYPNIVPKNQIV